jgi:hypothetical protein
MPSVFTKLPQDMLQYEIARFLDHRDVIAFNEVVKKDERVWKKLPADFALKHALDILQQEHNNIVKRYQIYLDADDFPRLRRTAKCMFRFCLNPRSEIAFMHQKGVRERLIRFLTPWVDEDSEVWGTTSVNRKEKLLEFARAALEWVSQIPFVRHVTLNPVRLTQSIF